MHHRQDELVRGVKLLGIGIGVGATVAALSAAARGRDRTVTLKTSVTIRRAPGDVYRFLRDFSNLRRFMRHVDDVAENQGVLQWSAKGPVGSQLEWSAELVADHPGERIAWRSPEGAKLPNHGAVLLRLAPSGRGTEVHLTIGFEPPGGALATKLVRLFEQVPEEQLKGDLRRLKQILETGEVVRSDASIHPGRHAARPASLRELPVVEGALAT